jgi:uncharacterized protein YjbJ (UPF0337 family)
MSEDKDTGPEAGVKGVVEDAKGRAKEAIGAVTGKDSLRDEGKAQQDKAAAERDVAAKEAAAEKARAEAEAHEARQRSHQDWVQPVATRWEYKIEPVAPDVGVLAELLSDQGAEGWELVTMVETDTEGTRRLVFRREPPNPTWDEQAD